MASYTCDVKGLRTFEALQLIRDRSVFIAVGKTSPWNEQEEVPAVHFGSQIEEVAAYKRADQLTFIMPDDNGTIEQRGQKWRPISQEEGIEQNCRWVYVQAWLSFDTFPVITFRQTGVFVSLTQKAEVPVNKQVLYPDDVVHPGFLIIMNNRTPISREATQKESVDFIIEF
ncbi:hypothetical protein [Brevibacillus dissolubilis]|uniref:hypothetical protein n=1 Tax=Brevibacillus dissolubilis TaxID=1844116 RepID=UPI00111791D7|nr:hypothetical protein [Brevibacillus dissolubilis]